MINKAYPYPQPSKLRLMFGVFAACGLLLVGCVEDDTFGTSSGTNISSVTRTSFTPRPTQSTGCPSACLNVDIATTRGIPPACQSACPEVQTSTQCLAAGGAYDSYVKNGRAGADAATQAQLYNQYARQAMLTRQVVERIGCR